MKRILFLLMILPLYCFSNPCFIVSDVKTDRILYNSNSEFSSRELFPGSLLKPFTILTAGGSDKIFTCTGWSDDSTRCWIREGHGDLNLTQALAYSCNSYFITYLKDKLEVKEYYLKLSEYLNFSGTFSEKDYILESIGLGTSIKTTPLNILRAYNKLYRENPNELSTIRQGMKECAYYGTGVLLPEISGIIDLLCKTGTSYRIKEDGSLDPTKNTGWFLIMYPAEEPVISLLTVIDASRSDYAVKEGAKFLKRWISEN